MSRLRSLLLAPIVRFFALGALIFGLYAVLDDGPAPRAADAIRLDAAEAARLAARFEATWRRPPTAEELSGLMRSWAEEEAFVREALALGLDRDDPVVRQRLRQKMVFFAESGADVSEPGEAALRAHYQDHRDRFATEARIAFEQVFLGPAPAPEVVEAARAGLTAGADPAELGQPTLLPAALSPSPANVVTGAFGEGFFEALAELPEGAWAGPVTSAFGAHLVRVAAHEPAAAPPFETVRERVERDWRATRADELRRAFAENLLARYEVTLPEPTEVLAR